jgi:3-carboxy-cis,cis-muconate cycloisomerase
MGVFESFLSTPEVTEVLSDRSFVAAMLRYQAALSRAQANIGLIPVGAAQSIIGTCKVELFDVPKLTRESARVRCLATPLLAGLKETVALFNADAARFVGHGCTRQNLIDSALALVSMDALALVRVDVSRTLSDLLQLASVHEATPLLASAPPTAPVLSSVGLQSTEWAAPLLRSLQRLSSVARQVLVVHLGDALPTSSASALSLAETTAVAALMATELQLGGPPVCMESRHDGWMLVASELGLLIASQGRMAADLANWSRSGLIDLAPRMLDTALSTGAGGSAPGHASWMVVSAAAQRAPHRVAALLGCQTLQHDFSQGAWQAALAEWHGLLTTAHGAARASAELVRAVAINTQRAQDAIGQYRSTLTTRDAVQRLGSDAMAALSQHTRRRVAQMRAELDLADAGLPPAATQVDRLDHEAPALVLA